MKPTSKRWTTVTPSEYPWEQEALDWLRAALPDHEPYRVWSNFELVAADGSINEIDALVLTSQGLFLVEIKSHRGALSGDQGTWSWRFEGREKTVDNPRLLANRKAKRLKSRLEKTKPFRKERRRLPFVESVVFLSATDLDTRGLNAVGRQGVLVRRSDRDSSTPIPGLEPLYSWTARPGTKLGSSTARWLDQAMDEIGIRRSQSQRKVGAYQLEEMIEEGPGWQDWRARHASLKVRRRLRLYHTLAATGTESRDTLIRAAKREMLILQGIDHPGIVRVYDYVEHEQGPALIFEDHADALRLDHWLRQWEAKLTFEHRLHLLRQLTEIVAFAHGHRLVHRSLSPQSILVLDPLQREPRLAVMSWHAGTRVVGSQATGQSGMGATRHPERLVAEETTVYLAPEVRTHTDPDGIRADIFSLGAIAYRLFSGRPPADNSLHLQQRLLEHDGLALTDLADGVSPDLADLVHDATRPDPAQRFQECQDLLEFLDNLLEELTAPDAPQVDPERAKKGDELAGGLRIERRLGQGSTAIVFEVVKDGQQRVLKLARDTSKNSFLDNEAEVLTSLRHHRIIELTERLEIGQLTGLLLASAGKETLAQRLRVEGRLSLDFLERFGADLLEIVQWLEEKGISHRDIKPENLGVQAIGRNSARHLVLFDFSLSRAPADRCDLGTVPYLDPFLRRPERGRWDLAAERFAAAMTLYQMATGRLPIWGDGSGDPLFVKQEVTLEEERFLPAVRPGLTEFFRRALRRDASQRFDHGEQMLRAWRRIFLEAEQPALPTPHDVDAETARSEALTEAVLQSPIIELGLSTRAFHALEKLGVDDVQGLLTTPLVQIQRMRGVGPKTRDELKETAKILRSRFPDVQPSKKRQASSATPTDVSAERGTASQGPTDSPSPDTPEAPDASHLRSVDRIAATLLPRQEKRGKGRDALRRILSLDDLPDGSRRANQSAVAASLGLTRARVSQLLVEARRRWAKVPALKEVRQDIVEALGQAGGVMTEDEVADALLATRGAVGGERQRSALAVARAASEVECSRQRPRWLLRRSDATVLLSSIDPSGDEASAQARASWVLRLGKVADRLAELDPLPAPMAVLEALAAVPRPDDEAPLPSNRLVRLAAAGSSHAAVSSRAELYPRGLSAARALNLAAGVAHGVKKLSIEQLRERVRGRYPEAEPLPERPALDRLLQETGLDLQWQDDLDGEGGGYAPRSSLASLVSSTGSYVSQTPRPVASEEALAAADFEQRLRRAADAGAFLILLTLPRRVAAVQDKLLHGFDLCHRSFDRLLLDALHTTAQAAKVDWQVVLAADAAEPTSRDGQNLRRLVSRALPTLEQDLLATEGTVLLSEPGLLGRYDLLPWLEAWRDRLARPEPGRALRGLWLLAPSDEQQDVPRLHGRPVPVVGPSEWTWVSESWMRGVHQGPTAD